MSDKTKSKTTPQSKKKFSNEMKIHEFYKDGILSIKESCQGKTFKAYEVTGEASYPLQIGRYNIGFVQNFKLIRGLKIKDEKPTTSSAPDVNYYAGADIVLQNEENWKEIRSQSEKNIQNAELIDKKIIEVNAKVKNQLQCIQQMNTFIATVPEFTRKIEAISNDLDALQKRIVEVEDFLIIFEDLVEVEEMNQNEVDERFKFSAHIERKSTETDLLKKELAEQYFEKVQSKEKKLQNTMKERQELFNMAFQQDMQLYKESGIVPKIPTTRAKENTKTVSLEDVVIEDDLGSLDDFVNS